MNGKRIDLSDMLSRYRGVVMGISALMILFFHDWIVTVGEFPVIGTIEGILKNYGYYGVDVFFLLSGMGLAYSMKKEPDVRCFYLKRFKRVYIPYVEVLVLKALLNKWTVPVLVSRVLCVELFTRGIYTFLWFVPMILWIYLFYPVMHRLLSRSKNDTILLAWIIVGAFLAAVMIAPKVHKDYYGLMFRLPTFLIGVWIGRVSLKRHIVCNGWQGIAGAAILAAAYMGCGYLHKVKGILGFEAMQLSAFALLFSGVICWLCAWVEAGKHKAFAIGKWGVKLLAFCGVFTLELYGVQEFHWYVAGPFEGRLTYLQINFLSLSVLILAAYLLKRLNEFLFSKV